MRAVNLIPVDQRRGGTGPGRSGAGVYALLGALSFMVLVVALYVLASNSITTNKAKVAKLKAQADQAEAQAATLRPYTEFATLSQLRRQTVSTLAASRFDWESTIRQVAKVLPGDVWLTSFVGTVAPGVNLEGAASTSSSLRGTLQGPAVELVGCTTTQSGVSRVMARLRRIGGVSRVTLTDSSKLDQTSAGPAAAGAGQGADCRYGSSDFPKFDIIVFFAAVPGASTAAPPAAGGAAPASPGQTGASGAQSAAQTTPTGRTSP